MPRQSGSLVRQINGHEQRTADAPGWLSGLLGLTVPPTLLAHRQLFASAVRIGTEANLEELESRNIDAYVATGRARDAVAGTAMPSPEPPIHSFWIRHQPRLIVTAPAVPFIPRDLLCYVTGHEQAIERNDQGVRRLLDIATIQRASSTELPNARSPTSPSTGRG
jgi:hypothetical protein